MEYGFKDRTDKIKIDKHELNAMFLDNSFRIIKHNKAKNLKPLKKATNPKMSRMRKLNMLEK